MAEPGFKPTHPVAGAHLLTAVLRGQHPTKGSKAGSENEKGVAWQAEGTVSARCPARRPRAAARHREACGKEPAGTGSRACALGPTCSHARTHMHTGQYLSRPSWATQPSWTATLQSPPREQAAGEERERLGRQEVHREWPQAPLDRQPWAEGGGGEGSDFLALGWLLGVGLCDYRGWDRDNEVSVETQESSGAQRILRKASVQWDPLLISALEQAALFSPWPCGWLAPQGAKGILVS